MFSRRSRCTLLLLAIVCAPSLHAQSPLPAAFAKPLPDSLQDLRAIEVHVQKLVDKLLPSTVCLRIGQTQGSGVLLQQNGYLLTAGHVSGAANQDAQIVLSDGSKLRGKTLGANNGIDSGMVRLLDPAQLPGVPMGKSSSLKAGDWCLALGHPGGYKPGRVPVARLGRVLMANDHVIITDCTLVGGDSGGPLFDMHGQVVGIHSRIGDKISTNVHVPIDSFRATWQRLTTGEVWGSPPGLGKFVKPPQAYLGLKALPEKASLKIVSVTPASPAEKAGLRTHDTILKMDQQTVASLEELSIFLKMRRPGTPITIQVQRGTETIAVAVVLGKRAH